jgi:hypothetical protein
MSIIWSNLISTMAIYIVVIVNYSLIVNYNLPMFTYGIVRVIYRMVMVSSSHVWSGYGLVTVWL